MPFTEVKWSLKNNACIPTVAAEKSLNITKDHINTAGNSINSSSSGLNNKEPKTFINHVSETRKNSVEASPTSVATRTEANDPPTKKPANNIEAVLTSLTAGAIAGALAKTTIAPLDRTKINFQIDTNLRYSLRKAVEFLYITYTKEGILGLWRGNSATMARIIPYAAIQFTAHEQWRKILKVDQDGTNTKWRRFIAGSLAGITSQSLTYPLDLARARMAVTDKYTGYKTLRQVFVSIWVEEGPHVLYRGYLATILGVIPYAGASFFTYETLKREYKEISGQNKPNALVSLIFGAAAGAVGQTSSYPLDIVRRRMQTDGLNKDHPEKYFTILGALKTIYREEGIKNGFYKGLSMNWIKGPIAVGISFSTYDKIKELIRELLHLNRERISKT